MRMLTVTLATGLAALGSMTARSRAIPGEEQRVTSKRGVVLACGASLALAVALALSATSGAAAGACPPDISGTTVAGPLLVSANQSCTLTNVTVNGPVIVQPGAILRTRDSTINGSLTSDGGTVQVCGGQVKGNVSITRTPHIADPGRGSRLTGERLLGICRELTVDGSVTMSGNDPANLSALGVVIKGSLTVSGNRGPQGGIFLAGNAVNGNMTVTDNKIEVTPAGGVFVGANTVTGRLTCTNNDFFFANGNTAAVLSGQCAVT